MHPQILMIALYHVPLMGMQVCSAPLYFEVNCNTTPNFDDFTKNAQPYYQISIKAMHPHFQIPNTVLFESCNNIWF